MVCLSPLSFAGMQLFHDLTTKVGIVTEIFEQVFRHLIVFPVVQRMGQPGGPDIFQSLICSHIKKWSFPKISLFRVFKVAQCGHVIKQMCVSWLKTLV